MSEGRGLAEVPLGARPVLVVDDDADVREALCDALSDEGYTVLGAENGRAALECLREGMRPAVILLDWMMPVMDGAQFHAELQKDLALADIPVVLLTADANPRQKADLLGLSRYLKKPVHIDDLIAAIRPFLRRA